MKKPLPLRLKLNQGFRVSRPLHLLLAAVLNKRLSYGERDFKKPHLRNIKSWQICNKEDTDEEKTYLNQVKWNAVPCGPKTGGRPQCKAKHFVKLPTTVVLIPICKVNIGLKSF